MNKWKMQEKMLHYAGAFLSWNLCLAPVLRSIYWNSRYDKDFSFFFNEVVKVTLEWSDFDHFTKIQLNWKNKAETEKLCGLYNQ